MFALRMHPEVDNKYNVWFTVCDLSYCESHCVRERGRKLPFSLFDSLGVFCVWYYLGKRIHDIHPLFVEITDISTDREKTHTHTYTHLHTHTHTHTHTPTHTYTHTHTHTYTHTHTHLHTHTHQAAWSEWACAGAVCPPCLPPPSSERGREDEGHH